ncbi:hypothetical protein F2Q70_00028556 [Brassica cretica]|uniref:Peptidase C1A papain C-terminal domain-containing protein n=1 Tax=Brassica cretica TaxID=69181 RepID=A0A8S9LHY4_BRACR|nr:hypothetical protein F2Q68_00028112 [Brassica cretica]KAF2605699.1 hypothetical protein F2Q70_00028556 [Brassica cretica]
MDKVLHQQEVDVCWAIALTRQLQALLRLHGVIAADAELSIQYLINESQSTASYPSLSQIDDTIYVPTLREMISERRENLEHLILLCGSNTDENEIPYLRIPRLIWANKKSWWLP